MNEPTKQGKSRFVSIRFQILVIILLTSIIPLLFMGFSFYKVAKNSLSQATINQLNTIADEERNKLNQRITYLLSHIQNFQYDPILLEKVIQLESYSNQPASLQYKQALSEVNNIILPFQKSENLTNVFLLKNEKIIYAANPDFFWRYQGKSLSSFYMVALHPMKAQGILYSDIYINPIREGEYDILFVAQLNKADNSTSQQIAFEIPIADFYPFLTVMNLFGYSTEAMLLTTNDHQIISIPRFDKSLAFKMALNADLNNAHTQSYLSFIDYRKHHAYAVARELNDLPWMVLNKIDVAELNNKVNHILHYTLIFIVLISGMLSILLIAVAIYLSRDITEPIKKLAAAARNMKAVKFKPHIDKELLSHNNEIGLLANSLIEMSDELNNYYHSLNAARQSALKASLAKSSFMASMSHELRTPLNAVIGYSEMLSEDLKDQGLLAHQADVDKINIAGRHLLSLINDVLDISKIEAGKMELFPTEIDVNQLLSDIAVIAKPLAETKHNQFIIESPMELGVMTTDVIKLRQSLLNLISNSCKFTDHGKIILRARRFEKNETPWMLFEITDTGIGISPSKLDQLFQPFSQVSSQPQYGGTGLGLYISLKFCKMLGGDITVTSTVNVGSTFTITLPIEFPMQ